MSRKKGKRRKKKKQNGVRKGIVRMEERAEDAIKSDKRSRSGCWIPLGMITAGIAALTILYCTMGSTRQEVPYKKNEVPSAVSAPLELVSPEIKFRPAEDLKSADEATIDDVIGNFRHNVYKVYAQCIVNKPPQAEVDKMMNAIITLFANETFAIYGSDTTHMKGKNAMGPFEDFLEEKGYFFNVNVDRLPDMDRIYPTVVLAKIRRKEKRTVPIFDKEATIDFIVLGHLIVQPIPDFAANAKDPKSRYGVMGFANERETVLCQGNVIPFLMTYYEQIKDSSVQNVELLRKDFGIHGSRDSFIRENLPKIMETVRIHEGNHYYVNSRKLIPVGSKTDARLGFLEHEVPSETLAILNELMHSPIPYYVFFRGSRYEPGSPHEVAFRNILGNFASIIQERKMPEFDYSRPPFEQMHKLSRPQIRDLAKESFRRMFPDFKY